jgi:hypothetical protein
MVWGIQTLGAEFICDLAEELMASPQMRENLFR